MGHKFPDTAGSPGCIDLTVQGFISEESESDSELAVQLDGEDEQGEESSDMCDGKYAREDTGCAVQAGALNMHNECQVLLGGEQQFQLECALLQL